MEPVNIGNRLIGPNHPPYIIAEIGSNHNGDMDLCRRIIDAAVACGADAVKFQSWSKSSLISTQEYSRNISYDDKKRHFGSLEAMVEKYQLTQDQHIAISAYCHEKKIAFLSSCFSPEEVDLLESLSVPAHKIASMDIVHVPLLEYVASTGKPIILSTGMAALAEIDRAVDILKSNGSGPIVLLHCISIYPPEYDDIHLNNIKMLEQTFQLPVGFSDHTIGTSIPLAAVALGACIIEKHFTLDKNLAGWDHWISAEPDELKKIVEESRNIFNALGNYKRIVRQAEKEKRQKFRRCVVIKKPLKRGDRLSTKDIDFKRPGTGISPDELKYIVGRSLKRDMKEDEELKWSDLQ
ncbi:MAG: polysaccharide biosynthesis protein [Desulfobacteraceae bacterium]|nr:MAG: polysaccharide biosynthesis protein [Desulfobacteraceae bacterium]